MAKNQIEWIPYTQLADAYAGGDTHKHNEVVSHEQGSEGWLNDRKGTIPSSSIATIFVFGTEEELLYLWEYIFGDGKDQFPPCSEEEHIRRQANFAYGHRFEHSGRLTYGKHFPHVVMLETTSTKRGIFGASADGYIIDGDDRRVYEDKSHATKNRVYWTHTLWYYVFQAIIEMYVKRVKACDFCSWTPANTKAWRIPWDDELFGLIREACLEFMETKQRPSLARVLEQKCKEYVRHCPLLFESASHIEYVSRLGEGTVKEKWVLDMNGPTGAAVCVDGRLCVGEGGWRYALGLVRDEPVAVIGESPDLEHTGLVLVYYPHV